MKDFKNSVHSSWDEFYYPISSKPVQSINILSSIQLKFFSFGSRVTKNTKERYQVDHKKDILHAGMTIYNNFKYFVFVKVSVKIKFSLNCWLILFMKSVASKHSIKVKIWILIQIILPYEKRYILPKVHLCI